MIVLKTYNEKVIKESKEELNKKLLREDAETEETIETVEEPTEGEPTEGEPTEGEPTEGEPTEGEGEATRMDVLKSVVDYFSAAIETAEEEDIEVDLDELVENVSSEYEIDQEIVSALVEGLYTFLFDEGEGELENTEDGDETAEGGEGEEA